MISRPCDGSTAFDRSEWVNVACDLTQAGSIARPGRRRRARAGERYRALVPKSEGQILRGAGRHGAERQCGKKWQNC